MSNSTQFNHAAAIFSDLIPVRFAETDLMGVVHHSAYIVWFEMGRIAWMAAAGVPYTEISATGHHFAVTGIQASYRTSATFGDSVVVATMLDTLRSRKVSFQYEIYHAEQKGLLVSGSSEHICVDLAGQMSRIPQPLLARLKQGAEAITLQNKME
ncbi:MAG: thioesterase family protein [Chloroflexota bacterium]